MAIFSTQNTRIAGMAACVPQKEVSNHDYSWISEKERNLLIKTTGVEKKRIVTRGTTSSDLCYVAAEKLISELRWDKNEIELLIFISQSRDYMLPHTSAILQDRLGLSKKCIAFDIGLGCTAFVYGLSVINSMMSSGGIKKGLLLMGEISSIGSYRDKSTYPLFGDAGSATAIEFSENEPPTWYNLQTDGSGFDAIIVPAGGVRNKGNKRSFEYKKFGKGIMRHDLHVVLNGIEVFNFSLREVAPNIKELLAFLEEDVDHIDYFVLHQANKLMNNTIRMKVKGAKEKFPMSLPSYGNTSTATIPVTMVTELNEELRSKKLKLVFSGFGVGLSWGSVLTHTENIVCPEIYTYEDHIKGLNTNQYKYKI
ncbi:MAG: ketoacyl-ACP synthase III [Bacteroidales bacterium]|nr:ketoacyl-ACP synthase III [Bacteroidales bacterium]MCF8404534.1 ketoacyl-ACP synthase III [Bacteroidales bacterium]